MLEWDQTDFIECLEVTPEEVKSEYHGPFSIFRVERKGINLELTVFPYEGDVRFRLIRIEEEEPIFEYQIMSCKSAKFERTKDGSETLIFINQAEMHVLLSVKPDVRLIVNENGL